jgi:hypothetical protein
VTAEVGIIADVAADAAGSLTATEGWLLATDAAGGGNSVVGGSGVGFATFSSLSSWVKIGSHWSLLMNEIALLLRSIFLAKPARALKNKNINNMR